MTRSEDFISMKYSFFEILCYGKYRNWFDITHVKVEFIPVLKIYTIPILGRFVWSTNFVQRWRYFATFLCTCMIKIAYNMLQFARRGPKSMILNIEGHSKKHKYWCLFLNLILVAYPISHNKLNFQQAFSNNVIFKVRL